MPFDRVAEAAARHRAAAHGAGRRVSSRKKPVNVRRRKGMRRGRRGADSRAQLGRGRGARGRRGERPRLRGKRRPAGYYRFHRAATGTGGGGAGRRGTRGAGRAGRRHVTTRAPANRTERPAGSARRPTV
eukprot:scaffold22439_cov108-Isochrysis_galbana.AAC.2